VAANFILWKHPGHRQLNSTVRLFHQEFSIGRDRRSAGIPGVPEINFLGFFVVALERHRFGVNNDDKITAIHMRGIENFPFSDKKTGNPGGQTAQNLVFGVDKMPFPVDERFIGCKCFL